MRKFRFQIENGYRAAGYNELVIKDYVAEVPDAISAALGELIDAYGGIEVFDKPAEPEAEAEKPKKKRGDK